MIGKVGNAVDGCEDFDRVGREGKVFRVLQKKLINSSSESLVVVRFCIGFVLIRIIPPRKSQSLRN